SWLSLRFTEYHYTHIVGDHRVQRNGGTDMPSTIITSLQPPRVIGPGDGETGQIGGIGVRFLLDAARTGGGFSLVEHPMPPRALGSPRHRHTNQDEYSYVLEGRVGVELGGETLYGQPGELILKPRGEWHAFWN